MTTILLTLFTIFFIGYSIFIYKGIKAKDSLKRLRGKLTLGIMVLFILFTLSLAFIYGNLSGDGYAFKTTYTTTINPNTKSVMVGTDENCDIQIFNRFSDSEHVVFDFTKEPMVEIISKRRSAIVNNKLITLKVFKDKNSTKEIPIENGDIIRLGYSDYRIHFTATEFELHNLFFSPSVVNLFNIYSTTTIPNLAKNAQDDTLSVWWVFLVTLMVVLMITSAILFLINMLTAKFALIGDNRYILYPILYFSFFLTFLLFVSIINFTVLQYHQFSVYNKGALYTVLMVYVMMLFTGYLAYLGYKKRGALAFGLIATVIAFPLFNHLYIYSSSTNGLWRVLNRTLTMTSVDWIFIFTVFGFGFGRLIYNLLKKEGNLFSKEQINIRPIIQFLILSFLFTAFGLVASFFLKEGAGIVIIETIKLFIFFLFTVVLLDSFQYKKNKIALSFWIGVIFIALMIAITVLLKDTGSLIQVIVAIGIISLFFYNHLKEINFINKKAMTFFSILMIMILWGVNWYINNSTNIRISMWVNPFEQSLEVKNQFYMYYYEQIARGLYLIKHASLFPNDFITQSYTPLANLHTDFIFAMFVNIFGMLGFVAIITAFVITIFSFDESIHLFQNSKRDIYRFIYGVNVIFVAYLFSYIIINMLSVLQIFPLTDVPFPILTYGRGVLILFFVLYVFVGVVNYLYLDFVSRRGRGRV